MKLKIIVLILSKVFLEHMYAQSAIVTDVADLIGNNEIISVKIDEEEYKFNTKGQLLIAQTNIVTDSIIYNKNGNIEAVYTFAYKKPREKIIIKYDENNLMIAADYFAPLNKEDYLVNSLIFENQKKSPNGIVKNYKYKEGSSTLEFHFNNNGLLLKQITIHPSQQYYWQNEIEYFDISKEKRKKKKQRNKIDNNIILENKWVLYNNKYNDGIVPEFNNLRSTNFTIKSRKNSIKNENSTSTIKYEYDLKGNVTKIIKEQFKNEEIENKIIEEFKYVYDNRGNWISRSNIYDGRKDADTIRTILYR